MTNQKNNKAMHISLWAVQGLLAAMFVMAGATKTFQPLEALIESLPWVADTSLGLVRFIGISELLGGLGLIFPSILRIKPSLTVIAALGIVAIMVLAAIFHASRGEFASITANALFASMALFIAWGRSKKNSHFSQSINILFYR